MSLETHERARALLAAARVEGLPASDNGWLQGHLAACPMCAKEVAGMDAAVRALRVLQPAADPLLARRTSLAVRRRAAELQEERARAVALGIATAMSTLWMIATAPYLWEAFAWFGRVARIPDAVWQIGFLLVWFLPATVLAVAAAWRHKTSGGGLLLANEIRWRQR